MSRHSAEPRCNRQIRARRVRLVDQHGHQHGEMSLEQALQLAEQAELDLVEVAPEARPPVARIMDYGRERYHQEKRQRAARRHRAREPHQLRLSPVIADHDLQTKLRAAQRFLEHGDQVRVQVQMRGRQRAHPELARQLAERFVEALAEIAVPVRPLQADNNSVQVTLGPLAKRSHTPPEH